MSPVRAQQAITSRRFTARRRRARGLIGHFIGAGLAIKNGSKIVKPAVILVLVLLAAKVIQGLIAG